MLRVVSLDQKLAELGAVTPPLESFQRIGDLTALRVDGAGRYFRSNYARGVLLHALVASRRPAAILEFGTGRGYGALCMARALADCGLPGHVYTIDIVGHDEKQEWWLDAGQGPETRWLSCREVWTHHFDQSWLGRITTLHGDSFEVMRRWEARGLPPVDLAFIDGGHRFDAVRHDLYSLLDVASPSFVALLDDYAGRPGFGVKALVDQEVAPAFDAELIVAGADVPQPASAGGGLAGMVLVDGGTPKMPLGQAFPRRHVERTLSQLRGRARRRRYVALATGVARRLAGPLRRRTQLRRPSR